MHVLSNKEYEDLCNETNGIRQQWWDSNDEFRRSIQHYQQKNIELIQLNGILQRQVIELQAANKEIVYLKEERDTLLRWVHRLVTKNVSLKESTQAYCNHVIDCCYRELKVLVESLQQSKNHIDHLDAEAKKHSQWHQNDICELNEEKEQLLIGFHYYKGLVDIFQEIIRGESHAVDRRLEAVGTAVGSEEASGSNGSNAPETGSDNLAAAGWKAPARKRAVKSAK